PSNPKPVPYRDPNARGGTMDRRSSNDVDRACGPFSSATRRASPTTGLSRARWPSGSNSCFLERLRGWWPYVVPRQIAPGLELRRAGQRVPLSSRPIVRLLGWALPVAGASAIGSPVNHALG